MTTEATCKERINEHYQSRMTAIRTMLNAEREGTESEEYGPFNEYGLCFDYVGPGTFTDQERGYFRYQISWGGPSDEFRFYCDERLHPVKIEYWFLDWNDGAVKVLRSKDQALMREVFEDWRECGMVEAAMERAEE